MVVGSPIRYCILLLKRPQRAPTGICSACNRASDYVMLFLGSDASLTTLFNWDVRYLILTFPRETLAAACLHAVTRDLGTDGLIDATKPLLHSIPMWDPMCGSGE